MFVCDCKAWVRSACAGRERFYKEHEGLRYCVLHFPGREKGADFTKAIRRKLSNRDFDFRGVWFPDELPFKAFHFTQKADFSYAEFTAGADFDAIFDDDADFTYAVFTGEAYFRYADFKAKVNFRSATFKSYFRLGEGALRRNAFLDLQYARIEKPEQVSFNTITLRPSWFVNVDARKFDFTNVSWDWRSIKEETDSLKSRKVSLPRRRLATACRQLAVNAEESHRYEEASKFRYMAMDTQRLKWKLRGNVLKAHWNGLRKTLTRLRRSLKRDWGVRGRTKLRLKRFLGVYWESFDLLHWLYWGASGYGERVLRASTVLLVLWLFFAGIYTCVGFARWEPRLTSESDVAAAKRDEV
ncbi:MAG TPA: pentapeptide repeat-containing protein, partial [Pyrinomonadaceae bacterium]|nr:pentapeptide repeat-containing protein [Pyrinomonadaceae bacterium]